MTYNFCINDFEGPLDLLLHLVKESKMDIYEVNIKDIIDQYVDFIHHLEDNNIDVASEYLVMSAELIHLKSRMLINKKEQTDENADFSIVSEEDLRNKLLEYEKYKKVTEDFKELEEKRNEVYTRLPDNLKEFMDVSPLKKGSVTLADLMNAILLFQERQKLVKPLNTKITKRELSVEERTNDIRTILKSRKKVNFIELFEIATKEYIIVTFLSILEMSKNNEIEIIQENNFSPIMIESVN
ncbi:MAG: segregation/condensation protein A [Bacilli bacterium]